jgi:NADP-dependent 3-hydroxy acid dehydrogenase YdfG
LTAISQLNKTSFTKLPNHQITQFIFMRRVVAITGASAGIGRATALRLARDGSSIAICARRRHRLDEVAAEIVRAGGQALPILADVTKEDDMRRFIEHTVSQLGRLDALMCNAGFGIYGPIEQVTGEQMRELLDINFLGTYYAARAAVPIFRQQNGGHLIVISSIVGQRGMPFMGAYAATKFAQVGLAESLRAELIDTPIRVSVVFPISTETEFFGVMTARSGHATRASGPRQSPETVADAIAWGLEHPTAEIYPHRLSRGLAILNAVAPALTDRIVKRWGRKPI